MSRPRTCRRGVSEIFVHRRRIADSGMRSAPHRDVKTLSLLLITTATLGFACHRNQAPTSPGVYAQTPPSAASQAPAMPEAPPVGIAIDPGAATPVPVREAVAVLIPLKGSRVTGVVR